MIFPPALGQQAGTQAPLALIGFMITDAGLAVLGILAVAIAGNSMDALVGKAGRKTGIILTAVIYFLLGPLFALPRTGSVSFEIGVVPFLEQDASRFVPMLIYTAVFFGLTYFFSLKPTKIIDIVGKIMSPLLLISIFVIFVAAMLHPLGEVTAPTVSYANGPFIEGLLQGYLALDGFAALVFAIIVIDTFREKGITERKDIVHNVAIVGIIAVILLCLVYSALCVVGAQTSGMAHFENGGVLLNYAVHKLFGKWGNIILGMAVILACLTTSIGLTSSVGNYFSKQYTRLSYKQIIAVICLFTWAVSNVGLAVLLKMVLPMLVVIYPMVTVLVILSFFDRFWKGRTEVYVFSMFFALAFSIFDGFKAAGISLGGLTEKMMKLPLASMGIGWLIPAFVGFLIGVSPLGKNVAEVLKKGR